MAEQTPVIPEGPANFVFEHNTEIPPNSIYTMPGRGTVTIEHLRGRYAVFWTTDKSTTQAYENIRTTKDRAAEIVAGLAILGKNSKPVSFRSVNFVAEILAHDSTLFAPELKLEDLDLWRLDCRNGQSYGYVRRPDDEPNEIIMKVRNLEDIVPFMEATAIPEIAERAKQYFGQPQ